ncbi:MAG TPA: hypothetical protein VG734_22960 [Lacunisphaera sp.]|nr:hypothetical protein [Lacunisphaera sp.]
MKAPLLFPLLVLSSLLAVAAPPTLPTWVPRPERESCYFAPVNFRGDTQLAPDIHRVAFLPIHGGEVAAAEITADLDPVLVTALQRQLRFEVVTVSREDCQHLFGAGDFGSTAALPHGFLEKIAEKYAVDAVLFTDLTVFQAYRPLSLGLRCKLAATRDVRLIWAFDEIFSSADVKMINSVRRHYKEGYRLAPVDPTPSVLQSPTRFGAVAADLMFRTLPPR